MFTTIFNNFHQLADKFIRFSSSILSSDTRDSDIDINKFKTDNPVAWILLERRRRRRIASLVPPVENLTSRVILRRVSDGEN